MTEKLTPSEALFGFMGWLTTRENPVTFSARHEAGIAAELVEEFCKANDLEPPRETWPNGLVFPDTRPAYDPSTAEGNPETVE